MTPCKKHGCRRHYAGEAYRSEFPVQYQLNHDLMLKSLVDRYFDVGPIPEAIWTALGWMQSDTTFDELRFLTAMTALETLIETELPAKEGTTIANSEFATLRASLEAAIGSALQNTGQSSSFACQACAASHSGRRSTHCSTTIEYRARISTRLPSNPSSIIAMTLFIERR